jgi:NAD(P)H-dependent flavin oxidoreductase YrpB (nitropropane dioxygenase family)
MSRLLDLPGSEYPIAQEPIGELNDPKMVATDSEAGVFGMLAPGFVRDLDAIEQVENTVEELVF